MIETLKKEGLDVSHLKVKEGKTAVTYMDVVDSKKIRGEHVEGVLEDLTFDEEDIRFACEHDLVHTSVFGKAEKLLPQICEKGVPISFDYADQLDSLLVEETLPYVTYGFFSYHKGKDEFIKEFLKDKVDRGMKIAVATFGEQGSLAYDDFGFHKGPIFPARKVVNTAGAGNSYIAGFLYEALNGEEVLKCMRSGARLATSVVEVFEPWVKEEGQGE